jgi:hypothetical protein
VVEKELMGWIQEMGIIYLTPCRFLLTNSKPCSILQNMFKCPHCEKPISDSLITAYSGGIGGRQTAKRGPGYFRKIAAMRKNLKGGRPKKNLE